MSDAIAFLLILPALVLGIVVLDAAGTLGTARYRTSAFSEAAAVQAADALGDHDGAEPSDHPRWEEVSAAVEEFGVGAMAGVCDQTDEGFDVRVVSHGPTSGGGGSSSVAVVVGCPVELGGLLVIERVTGVGIEGVG